MEADGMRYLGAFFLGSWVVATLLTTCGCGSNTEASSEQAGGPAAAINGSDGPSLIGGAPAEPGKASDPALTDPRTGQQTDPLRPVVVIETSQGDITVQLDAEKADFTADNFLSYVEKGHYDQTIFHQVLENYVILGGGFGTDFSEKPGETTIYNQADNGLRNSRGTIAMARNPQIIDSATCQFFINVADNPQLDHQSDDSADTYGYCVFGKVVGGMEVVDAISRVEVRDTEQFERTPVQPVVIRSVRRIR
jgi:cyclophilin family peptidyl-prolyl cis-trans isomerase